MKVIAPDEPAVEAVARRYRLTVAAVVFNCEVTVVAATAVNVIKSAHEELSAEC